jgi:hypothetical protein
VERLKWTRRAEERREKNKGRGEWNDRYHLLLDRRLEKATNKIFTTRVIENNK